MNGSPSAFHMGFYGVHDASGEAPCSPRASTLPKLVCNGLMLDVKRTYVEFVYHFQQ